MLKNMRIFAASVVSALISCIVLVGCGTKGPLYIPEQRYPQKESSQKPIQQDEAPKTAPQANTDAVSQPAQ